MSLIVVARHKSAISTYKTSKFHAISSPNIANVDFNIKANDTIVKLQVGSFCNKVDFFLQLNG